MTKILVDVEADGPCPGMYSMVSFGAVICDEQGKFNKTFYGKIKPISDDWIPEALAVSGFTREQTLEFDDPYEVMMSFKHWIEFNKTSRPIFVSDNNGFDWQFVNYYFHKYIGTNPFGHSSRNLNDIWKGMKRDTRKNFKHLRDTKHTHHPVQDSKGNAEALYKMVNNHGLKWKL